jgi:hypothetical protein
MQRSITNEIWTAFRTNYQLVMLTFEIFWIIVFLLDRLHGQTSGSLPRFVYVNF